jgi:hypothetical protein
MYMSYIVHQVNILINILLVKRIFSTDVIDKLLSRTFGRQNIALVKLNSAYDYEIH